MSGDDARLADHLRDRGPLTPDAAARLLLPLAASLAEVHAASGVHGRLSPAAVVVESPGRATLRDAGRPGEDPEFTAPEVSAGARPDAASDVWAFAGVLLHATTGRSPYSPAMGPRDGGWLRPLTELALHPDPRQRPTMADVAAYLRARVGTEERAGRGVSGVGMALVGAAAVALLGIAGVGLLLTSGGNEPAAERRPTETTSSPPSSEASSPAPARSPRPERPTAAELEEFARTYIATASSNPDRGFTRLTRAYRQQSPRYHEVWTAIADPEILTLTADPDALSVTYTYRYRLPDGTRRTEDVTLQLVQRGDQLLIAGASSRPL